VHFSDELPDDYYMQLSAEIFDPNKRAWVKLHGRRNEALDTHVYAMVAALHPRVRVHVQREHDWLALERVIEPKGGDLFRPPLRARRRPNGCARRQCRGWPSHASLPVQTSAPAPAGRAKPNWVTGFKGK
jgi:phage terminase large subunit GpA-like protein